MKKAIVFALALCILLTMCAACDKKTEASNDGPAPTSIPFVTAPPDDMLNEEDLVAPDGSKNFIIAEDNSAPFVGLDPNNLENASEEAKIALTMEGEDLEDLIEAIGEPQSTEYTLSCIAPDSGALDGLLFYEDFTVSTIRYPDGSEIIQGVF